MRRYYFSSRQAIKSSSGQMRQLYAYDANERTRRLVKGGMSTGLTNTHTTRFMDSLLCITCSIENNAFSVLHNVRKVILHYLCYNASLKEIRDSFCLGTFGFIGLPPRSLASTRGCFLAVTMYASQLIRYMLQFAHQNWI